MPAYGPWTQDDDYSFATFVTRDLGATRVATHFGLPFVDGPSLENMRVDLEEFPTETYDVDAPALFDDIYASDGREINNGGLNHLAYTTGGGTFPEFASSIFVRAGSAMSAIIAPSADYTPFPWPDDAIDIEYEDGNNLSERLEILVQPDTVLAGSIFQNTPELSANSLPDSFATRIYADHDGTSTLISELTTAPSDAFGSGPEKTRTLGSTIDLTAMMAAASGEKILIRVVTDDFVGLTFPPDGLSAETRTWEYGWWLTSLRLAWTYRPPRYRWVYDTVPYRRIFPRDDGLAGGAPRSYPASKSVQNGIRTSGGYL